MVLIVLFLWNEPVLSRHPSGTSKEPFSLVVIHKTVLECNRRIIGEDGPVGDSNEITHEPFTYLDLRPPPYLNTNWVFQRFSRSQRRIMRRAGTRRKTKDAWKTACIRRRRSSSQRSRDSVVTPKSVSKINIIGYRAANVGNRKGSIDEHPLARLSHFKSRLKIFNNQACARTRFKIVQLSLGGASSGAHQIRLIGCYGRINGGGKKSAPSSSPYRILYASICILICGGVSYRLIVKSDFSPDFRWDIPLLFLAFIIGALGFCMLLDSFFDVIQDLNNASGSLATGAVSHRDTVTMICEQWKRRLRLRSKAFRSGYGARFMPN